jgi:hypothetical protein
MTRRSRIAAGIMYTRKVNLAAMAKMFYAHTLGYSEGARGLGVGQVRRVPQGTDLFYVDMGHWEI